MFPILIHVILCEMASLVQVLHVLELEFGVCNFYGCHDRGCDSAIISCELMCISHTIFIRLSVLSGVASSLTTMIPSGVV